MSPSWRRKGHRPEAGEGPGAEQDLTVWLDAVAAADYADVLLPRLSQAIKTGELPVGTDPARPDMWMVNLRDLEEWSLRVLGRPAPGRRTP